jgi:hypothetical protein
LGVWGVGGLGGLGVGVGVGGVGPSGGRLGPSGGEGWVVQWSCERYNDVIKWESVLCLGTESRP